MKKRVEKPKSNKKSESQLYNEELKSPKFQKYLYNLVQEAKFMENGGKVADYIPQLRMALKSKTGITLHFPDKTMREGDCNKIARNRDDGSISEKDIQKDDCFTIQSISKVFALLYALECHGSEDVFKRIGKEPTGDPFNADPRVKSVGDKRIPYNPLINVGAILITSMFPGEKYPEQFEKFFKFVKIMCGNQNMIVEEGVYDSERKTSHNNRALAWKMHADDIFISLTSDNTDHDEEGRLKEVKFIEGVLNNYFRQCSILVNSDDLARAACVLAKGGIEPGTGKRIVKEEYVTSVVSLMSTCGLYDGSGEFAYNIGIPGKSGVGGGIMCVVPGRFGIATFSPALDEQGNSLRGLYMLKKLSQEYKLHIFNKEKQKIEFKRYGTSGELGSLVDKIKNDVPQEYKPAQYIPELRNVNSLEAGVSIYTIDGELICGGDHEKTFSLQSISNLFGLLYVLNMKTEATVFRYVGKEPSGEPFNILKWDTFEDAETKIKIPFNPMINAGAIALAAMIPRKYEWKDGSLDLNIDNFLMFVRKLCGNEDIKVNSLIYESEKKTGFYNRALAWLMNDKGVFNEILIGQGVGVVDNTVIEAILDIYFKLCSIDVTCDDLARFGAVLANGGKNIKTKEQIITTRYSKIATAMMSSGGLYDGSGEFAYNVGIPAKSGVSGGIVGVVPGKMGIATFSPVIDEKGNSYRGQKIFKEISKTEELSIFSGGR